MWLTIKIDARCYSFYFNILRLRKKFCPLFRPILNAYSVCMILSNLFTLSSCEPHFHFYLERISPASPSV